MAKYEKWLEKESLILVQAWARDGCTEETIARKMGISYTTLKDWKHKFPTISAALKNGKEVVDISVENALLKAAMAGESWAVCFWLKNRRSDKWRDRPDDKMSAEEKTARIDLIKAQTKKANEDVCGGPDETGVVIDYDI